MLPQSLRGPLFGGLGRVYPKADWAPRPLRAKATLLSLAQEGDEGYAAAVGVTGGPMRSRLLTADARAALQGHRAEDRYIQAMRNRSEAHTSELQSLMRHSSAVFVLKQKKQ